MDIVVLLKKYPRAVMFPVGSPQSIALNEHINIYRMEKFCDFSKESINTTVNFI